MRRLTKIPNTAGNPICNLCGERNFFTLENNEHLFRVLKCRNCSLVFVHPHPMFSELKGHYDETYYSAWIGSQKEKRARMWNCRLNRIKKYKTGGKLLDVGCGEGAFLVAARQNRWQINGTELSSFAAQQASAVPGAEIFCGDLPDADYPDNYFDVVTMWHVLEHVPNPRRYLAEIFRIIKNDGILVMAVPNVDDLLMQAAYRIVKGRKMRLFSIQDKELHLYHFSAKTLKAFLDITGFECMKLSPDYGIVEPSKKIINLASVILYYLTGIKLFNALEVFAVPRKAEDND